MMICFDLLHKNGNWMETKKYARVDPITSHVCVGAGARRGHYGGEHTTRDGLHCGRGE